MTSGFRIGFQCSSKLSSLPQNMGSTHCSPEEVDRYIATEVASGGLRLARQDEYVHISPIGLIPKPHQPGKFRLIVDLSSPAGGSVNDGIPAELCSLTYMSLDQAVQAVACHGVGALMAKLDLQSAYRHVPVYPDDQHLLAIRWRDSVFCDRALPFGLRSAPKLFTAVADALAWAMRCEGVHSPLHYLDDFFFSSAASSSECARALEIAVPLCHKLGLPVAPSKVVGPTTSLVFLGIHIDSVFQQVSLPGDKCSRLLAALSSWSDKRSASKRQLQSLLGHLNHASSVVRPGRPFLRNLIDTMKRLQQPHHKSRLPAECRADILWWHFFVSTWNGKAFFPGPSRDTIISDASGSWGCGAFLQSSGEWFHLAWPASWDGVPIQVKELVPVVLGATLWGHRGHGGVLHVLCDNMSVVNCVRGGSSKDPRLAHLLRILALGQALGQFDIRITHIAGRRNVAADALSRNNLMCYFSLCPQAPRVPFPIPPQLETLVLDRSASWMSGPWIEQLRSCLLRAFPQGQDLPTPLLRKGTSLSASGRDSPPSQCRSGH